MSTSTEWQLAHEAAERYETILVPAILGPFARALVDWSNLHPGETVVDVGCGTGTAARYAAERVGPAGRVIGVDINAGMIGVAGSIPPSPESAPVEWYENSAYQLFLDDNAAGVALCAQTLQFLADRGQALSEMYRVLQPAGRVAVSLWCAIEENPYFQVLLEAVARHVGPETAAGLGTAFGLTSAEEIQTLMAGAHFQNIVTTVMQLDLALPELAAFVPRHISATPMSAGYVAAGAAAQQAVVGEIVEQLAEYQTGQWVQIPFRSHLAMAVK